MVKIIEIKCALTITIELFSEMVQWTFILTHALFNHILKSHLALFQVWYEKIYRDFLHIPKGGEAGSAIIPKTFAK